MIHNNIFWAENHQASPSVADVGPALALQPQIYVEVPRDPQLQVSENYSAFTK